MKWFFIGLLMIGMGYKAQGIKITDFEPPVSRAKSLFLLGDYDYTYERKDDGGKTTIDQGGISLDFTQFYSSLPFAYNVFALGSIGRDGLAEADSEKMAYDINGVGQINKYLYQDLFGFAKLSVDEIRGYFIPKFSPRKEEFSASVGIGHGRFIIATPMARAVRVAEELGRVDLLTGILPDTTYLLLAEQLDPYVIRSYQEHYDFWEREYYRDVSRILRESGQLREGVLGSVGTIVVSDILDEYILERYYGYEVTGGFGYSLSITPDSTRWKPFIGVSFDFGYPIGLKSQFTEFLTLRNYIEEGRPKSELYIDRFILAYSYEISNNLDLVLRNRLEGNIPFKGKHSLSDSLAIEFRYYLVNQLHFVTTFSIATFPGELTEFDTKFQFEIKYRIF